jgi:hypothetical protein
VLGHHALEPKREGLPAVVLRRVVPVQVEVTGDAA